MTSIVHNNGILKVTTDAIKLTYPILINNDIIKQQSLSTSTEQRITRSENKGTNYIDTRNWNFTSIFKDFSLWLYTLEFEANIE